MAESTRIDALSIELQTSGKDKLAEEYGKVIENINANTLSAKLKNKDLSGDPTSGSVEAKRFVNAKGQAYGTARSGKAGNKIKAKPVIIPIDDNTEYIEEVEEKDIKLYGVNGLIERRTANHQKSMEVELETKFFKVAADSGTEFEPTETAIEDEMEEAIQKVETVKNDFVRGVPRNMINVIMTPSKYGKLRNKIATLPNANANVASYESGIFNNTKVYSNVFLPDDVEYIVMVDGAVAQPVLPSIYSPKKIELSDATGFGMFLYKGTKAVMEDLIFVKKKIKIAPKLEIPEQNATWLNKKISDMIGPGATVDEEGNVNATLKKVEGFTDFSSEPSEQSGHYFPFSLTVTGSKMTFKKNGSETKKDIAFDKDIIFRTEKTDTWEVLVDNNSVVKLNFANATFEE